MIEEETNPLWMPRGSVRALRMIALTGVVAYLVLNGKPVPDWFQLLAVGDLASYSLTRVFAPRRVEVKEPVDLDAANIMRQP